MKTAGSPAPLHEAAIDWLVVLRSGEATPDQLQDFDRWLVADPSHARVWDWLTARVDSRLGGLKTPAGGSADTLASTLAQAQIQSRNRRRMLKGTLAVGGLSTATAGLMLDRAMPLAQLFADYRTGTGERQWVTLADGSTIQLDARSAIDILFTPELRLVVLREGALLADVAPANTGGRNRPPFVVRTAQGTVRALGTRFAVRQRDDHTEVAMLLHRVELSPEQGLAHQLDEGQVARMTRQGVTPIDRSAHAASAWQGGLAEMHDQPLADLVAALKPYARGYWHISPRAAECRVYGSYPLDDPDRTLQLMAETLPLRIRRYTGGWLVRIAMRDES